jgi:hypothetical protein
MMKELLTYFTTLDLYGQPIRFWYKGSRVFTSKYGILMSLVIIVLILSYFVQLVVDIYSADKPQLIDITTNSDIPPRYDYMVDYLQLFNMDYNYTQIQNETVYGVQFQPAFGFQNLRNGKVSDYDPTLVNLVPIHERDVDNSQLPIYYDFCRRFPFLDPAAFDYFEMNKALCIFTNFSTEASSLYDNYQKLKVDFNACTNNTYVYAEKTKYQPYIDLQEKFKKFEKEYIKSINGSAGIEEEPIVDNSTTTNNTAPVDDFLIEPDEEVPAEVPVEVTNPSTEVTDSTSSSSSPATPGTLRILEDTTNADTEPTIVPLTEEERLALVLANPSKYIVLEYNDNTMKPNEVTFVRCKPKTEIVQFIKDHELVYYFTNAMYNVTKKEEPINHFLDTRVYGFSSILNQYITFIVKHDKFISYNSLLPYTMIKNPPTFYFANLDYDTIRYGDFNITNSSNFMTINIVSSKLQLTSQRTYPNIFNVMGTIGGVNKVLIIVASIIVGYYANLKLKEQLINDLYSVIDPNNDHLVQISFKDYVLARSAQMKAKKSSGKNALNTIIPDSIVEKLLDGKMNKSDMARLESKYEILYEVYKYQVYGGLRYTFLEDFSNTFCFCCLSKKLKRKNKLFKKACQKLEADTDFVAITKSIQEFETLKKVYLDTPQCDLFNSYRNDEITLELANKAVEQDKKDKKNNATKEEHKGKSEDDINLIKKAERLNEIVAKYMENKKINLMDKQLLDGLIEDQESYERFIQMFDLKNRDHTVVDNTIHSQIEDENLSPEELKNIERAFKKN